MPGLIRMTLSILLMFVTPHILAYGHPLPALMTLACGFGLWLSARRALTGGEPC